MIKMIHNLVTQFKSYFLNRFHKKNDNSSIPFNSWGKSTKTLCDAKWCIYVLFLRKRSIYYKDSPEVQNIMNIIKIISRSMNHRTITIFRTSRRRAAFSDGASARPAWAPSRAHRVRDSVRRRATTVGKSTSVS